MLILFTIIMFITGVWDSWWKFILQISIKVLYLIFIIAIKIKKKLYMIPFSLVFAQVCLAAWYFARQDMISLDYRLSVTYTMTFLIFFQLYVFNLVILLYAFPKKQKHLSVTFVILHTLGSNFRLFGFNQRLKDNLDVMIMYSIITLSSTFLFFALFSRLRNTMENFEQKMV